MLNQKAMTALLSLALAGSMAVPALAADAGSAQPLTREATPVLAEYGRTDSVYLPIAANGSLTRAELVAALHEQAGKPSIDFILNYTDVDSDAPYAEAIRWASGEGFASGYGNGRFGPDDGVTREQMALILYRYAQDKGLGFTGAWAFPLPYEDASAVSSYAYEAVCWMTMKDIMGSTDENRFAPQQAVTQDEANAILEAFFNTVGQVEIANPFVSCQTLDEAAGIARFSLNLPQQLPSGMEVAVIRAAQYGLIEVVCQGDDQQLTIRKGPGSEDISGDYSVYSEVATKELDGRSVTAKGQDGTFQLAVWCDGDYSYAVHSTKGLDWDALSALVSDIK